MFQIKNRKIDLSSFKKKNSLRLKQKYHQVLIKKSKILYFNSGIYKSYKYICIFFIVSSYIILINPTSKTYINFKG